MNNAGVEFASTAPRGDLRAVRLDHRRQPERALPGNNGRNPGHDRGSIVNIGSAAGLIGYENFSVYCSTKADINGPTMTAAIDYGKYGVRVNAIHRAPSCCARRWSRT
ncbi:SDR family oxidoreductase [Rhodococcus sp. IC4_135]|nr:SDR family oxidoreductase [Rhodococcus sp. IC4_135]